MDDEQWQKKILSDKWLPKETLARQHQVGYGGPKQLTVLLGGQLSKQKGVQPQLLGIEDVKPCSM